MAERVECGGKVNPLYQGNITTIDACAQLCHGKATLFKYGTNDYGNQMCCHCSCMEGATEAATCHQTPHNGYRLYKYEEQKVGKAFNAIYPSNTIEKLTYIKSYLRSLFLGH